MLALLCVGQLIQPASSSGVLLQQSDVAANVFGFAAVGNGSLSEAGEPEPAERFPKIVMLKVRGPLPLVFVSNSLNARPRFRSSA